MSEWTSFDYSSQPPSPTPYDYSPPPPVPQYDYSSQPPSPTPYDYSSQPPSPTPSPDYNDYGDYDYSPLPPSPPPSPAAPHAGPFDLKLSRSDFVADCNAAIYEICNKVEAQCQPFLCKQEMKTNKGLVEAFGTAFANYGLATAILMPLFALVVKRIGRKPAEAAAGGHRPTV